MEVKLAIKKFEQDTMPKFSVYQKDKTFEAKVLLLSLFRTIRIFRVMLVLESIVITCHEISVLPWVFLYSKYRLWMPFCLTEGFYFHINPVNVTYYLHSWNYISDGILLILSWNYSLPTAHKGAFFFWEDYRRRKMRRKIRPDDQLEINYLGPIWVGLFREQRRAGARMELSTLNNI